MLDSVQFCTVPIVALEGTPELIEPSREAETSELKPLTTANVVQARSVLEINLWVSQEDSSATSWIRSSRSENP